MHRNSARYFSALNSGGPGLDPRTLHVEFVVYKVTLGQISVIVFRFSATAPYSSHMIRGLNSKLVSGPSSTDRHSPTISPITGNWYLYSAFTEYICVCGKYT
jgi:hypothetical protein